MTHTMDGGRVGSYWMQRLPASARIPVYALLFGGMWFLLSPDQASGVVLRAAGAAVAGVCWGLSMFFVMRRWERRRFGDATPQQRVAVLQCLDTGRLPDDEPTRQRVIDLARWRLRRRSMTVPNMVLLAAMGVVSVALAVWQSPRWWVMVVIYAVIIPSAMINNRRQRRAAQAVLEQSHDN